MSLSLGFSVDSYLSDRQFQIDAHRRPSSAQCRAGFDRATSAHDLIDTHRLGYSFKHPYNGNILLPSPDRADIFLP
jgi:hypothetical protein